MKMLILMVMTSNSCILTKQPRPLLGYTFYTFFCSFAQRWPYFCTLPFTQHFFSFSFFSIPFAVTFVWWWRWWSWWYHIYFHHHHHFPPLLLYHWTPSLQSLHLHRHTHTHHLFSLRSPKLINRSQSIKPPCVLSNSSSSSKVFCGKWSQHWSLANDHYVWALSINGRLGLLLLLCCLTDWIRP